MPLAFVALWKMHLEQFLKQSVNVSQGENVGKLREIELDIDREIDR